ncbi:hypothetical protein ONZ45_g11639 [Pleurotus djamor]|nr:hypothetical protein ONZ45_g11639 [Pleurotus djamor]
MADAKALILVYSEPGSKVAETAFNKWFDEEHIPALTGLRDFHTFTRYKAVDDKKPSWLTLYDVTSPEVVNDKEVQAVSTTISEDGLAVVSDIAMLNRRVLSLKVARSAPNTPSTLRGKVLLLILMQPSVALEEELVKWYEEEHMDVFSKTPGWIRGRVYKLEEGPIELAENPSADVSTNPDLKYLAIHELADKDGLASPEAQNSLNTPRGQALKEDIGDKIEQRVFEIYKEFEKK